MNKAGTEKPMGGRGKSGGEGAPVSEKKLRRMQSRQKKMRANSVKALLLAVVLLTASILGGKVTSDREQEIRLALGQKNYVQAGEEGPQYFETEYSDPEELAQESAELGLRIQREGIVLLRNEDGALPLSKGASVSVFGKSAVSPVYIRTDAAEGSVSFKEALEQQKIRVNDKLWNFIDRGGRNNFSASVEKSMEEYAEAAVIVIGRGSGGRDLYEPAYSQAEEGEEAVVTGAAALQLTQEERDLLAYAGERFDRIIVVLNTENPMEMGFLDEFGIDACLWTGALGQGGMQAVAEVLSGSVNPSGRLPDTFVYNSLSAPAAANLGDYTIKNSEEEFGDKYLVYTEGIYVGYRYYETRYEDAVLGTSSGAPFSYGTEVAFPFGFGLSYTDFEIRNMKMELGKKGYEVTAEVHNTGGRAGREVVQFYIQKPYSQYASKNGLEVPAVELVGFSKTAEIEPGESARVKIVIPEESFKSFDAGGKGTYIIDGGTYLVTAAQNAHAAVNNILMYKSKGGSPAFTGTGDGGLVEKAELVRDYKTYAESAQTGEGVSRRFKEADPAAYDSDYRALTRSLWGSTWPGTWKGGSFSAPSSFQELLKVSSKDDGGASSPVYNTSHGEKNAGLAQLRETEFDDYRWNALLDQLTWRETYSIVRKGGGVVNEVISCISPQALISGDGAGLRTGSDRTKGFVCPSATVLAATWNTDLLTQMGQLVGEEALHAGISFWKIPSLNLHRTTMGGANAESF